MAAAINFSKWETDARLPNKCTFQIDNIHVGVVNAIRRAILSNIPNVAVRFDAYKEERNDCVFHTNTSALHNEFLGHRLSLIPVHLPPEVINTYDSEDFRFLIDEQNTSTELVLFARDGRQLSDEERDKIFPPDPITGDYVLITKLRPNLYDTQHGEKLHVEFRAAKGIAQDNASWCPVSLCTYKFVINPHEAKAALEAKLADIQDDDDKARAVKLFETLENQRFYWKDERGDPCKFQFALESECAMSPQYLFDKALDVLMAMLQNIVSIKDKYIVHTINEEQHLYSIAIDHEDHTIGNLLQVLIYENFVRPKKGVTFAGYNVPHPLESRILLKVKFDRITNVNAFIEDVVSTGVDHIRIIQVKWRAFTNKQQDSEVEVVQEIAPVATKRRIIGRNKK